MNPVSFSEFLLFTLDFSILKQMQNKKILSFDNNVHFFIIVYCEREARFAGLFPFEEVELGVELRK